MSATLPVPTSPVLDAIASALRVHAPAPVIVLTPTLSMARWLRRHMVARGVTLGLHAASLDAWLMESAVLLAGAPLPPGVLLPIVQSALGRRFVKVREQASYQQAVLQLFVDLAFAETAPDGHVPAMSRSAIRI